MRWKKRSFVGFALAALASCAHHDGPALTTASGNDGGIDAALVDGEFDAGPAPTWRDAVRKGAWNDAATAIDALTDAEKKQPELVYLRARVAFEQKDFSRVVALLENVEAALPLLADSIAKRRALAELEVGPYDKAAEYFSAHPGAEAQLDASRAYERAGNPARSTIAADHAVSESDRTRAQEAEARGRRLRLGLKNSNDNVADAKWLALHAPDLPDGRDAMETLAHLDPAHPLTGVELLDRAKAFADAGRTDEAIAAIDASVRAPSPNVTIPVRLRAKADALMHDRKRAMDAARAYDAAVNASGTNDAEDAVHAARAMSHADHDDEAIARYAGILARFPRTPWAEQAAFLGARLELLHGRWTKAAADFDAYVKTFANGASRKDAERGRAIAHLMNGDAKGAQAMFERIADADPASTAADLAALAALREGDKTYALTRWTNIANESPSSWRAMIARARLALEAAPPPRPDPPPVKPPMPPLAVKLVPPADMLHAIGLDDEAQSALFSRENVIMAGAPARSVELGCETYGLLDVARRREQLSLRIARPTFVGVIAERDRWAWTCAYPEPYADMVLSAEQTLPLPRGLVHAVMRQESEFLPTAISPAHAVGLMQLLPETARVVEGDPKIDEHALMDPATSIRIGAKYLRALLTRFHGSIPLAVAAYNAGPEAIERWIARSQGETLDVFVEKIPYAETRAYVIAVMSSFGAYAAIHGEAEIPPVSLSLTGPGTGG